jgi:hypothetical protein
MILECIISCPNNIQRVSHHKKTCLHDICRKGSKFTGERWIQKTGKQDEVPPEKKELAGFMYTPQKQEADTQEAEEELELELYNPTLLATIRILNEVKGQSNIEGWIHTGGLWGAFWLFFVFFLLLP